MRDASAEFTWARSSEMESIRAGSTLDRMLEICCWRPASAASARVSSAETAVARELAYAVIASLRTTSAAL